MGSAVSEGWGRFGGFAERAVEAGGELRGVGADGDFLKACGVEGGAHCGYPAVHHVGRGHDIGACAGMSDGALRQPFEGFVVLDVAGWVTVEDSAAVAVSGVLTVADVGHYEEVRGFFFDSADGSLDYAVVVVIFGG